MTIMMTIKMTMPTTSPMIAASEKTSPTVTTINESCDIHENKVSVRAIGV